MSDFLLWFSGFVIGWLTCWVGVRQSIRSNPHRRRAGEGEMTKPDALERLRTVLTAVKKEVPIVEDIVEACAEVLEEAAENEPTEAAGVLQLQASHLRSVLEEK